MQKVNYTLFAIYFAMFLGETMKKNIRAQEMLALAKLGFTLEAIGKHYGVSKQRVSQIIIKTSPNTDRYTRGSAIRKFLDEDKMEKATQTGMPLKHHRTALEQAQFDYLRRLKQNVKKKGIIFDLPFNMVEWNIVCPLSGTPIDWFSSKISKNSPACRLFNRESGYVPGNVEIVSWGAYRKYISENIAKSRATLV